MSPPHPVCGKQGSQPVVGKQVVHNLVWFYVRCPCYEPGHGLGNPVAVCCPDCTDEPVRGGGFPPLPPVKVYFYLHSSPHVVECPANLPDEEEDTERKEKRIINRAVATAFGNGAHITVPKGLIGRTVVYYVE